MLGGCKLRRRAGADLTLFGAILRGCFDVLAVCGDLGLVGVFRIECVGRWWWFCPTIGETIGAPIGVTIGARMKV